VESLQIDADGVTYLPFARQLLSRLKMTLNSTSQDNGAWSGVSPDGQGRIYVSTRRNIFLPRAGMGSANIVPMPDSWFDIIRITVDSAHSYLFVPYVKRTAGSVVIELEDKLTLLRLDGAVRFTTLDAYKAALFPLVSAREPRTSAVDNTTGESSLFLRARLDSLNVSGAPQFVCVFNHVGVDEVEYLLGSRVDSNNALNRVDTGAVLTESGDNRFITGLLTVRPSFAASSDGRKVLVDYGVVTIASVAARYVYQLTVDLTAAPPVTCARVVDTLPYGSDLVASTTSSSATEPVTYPTPSLPDSLVLLETTGETPTYLAGATNSTASSLSTYVGTAIYPQYGLTSVLVTTQLQHLMNYEHSVEDSTVYSAPPAVAYSVRPPFDGYILTFFTEFIDTRVDTHTADHKLRLTLPNGYVKDVAVMQTTAVVTLAESLAPLGSSLTTYPYTGSAGVYGSEYATAVELTVETTEYTARYVKGVTDLIAAPGSEYEGFSVLYSDPAVPVFIYEYRYYSASRMRVVTDRTEHTGASHVVFPTTTEDSNTGALNVEVVIIYGTTERVLFSDSVSVTPPALSIPVTDVPAGTYPGTSALLPGYARKSRVTQDALYAIVVKDASHWVVGRMQLTDLNGASNRRFDLYSSNLNEVNLRDKFVQYMIKLLDNDGTPLDATALADFQSGDFAPYDIRLMDPRLIYPGLASFM